MNLKIFHITLLKRALKMENWVFLKVLLKFIKKKGYYSKDREKEIIFDLSIEIWPKNADKYTLLYLIECKSSIKNNKVPVDDVEEFFTKINQVAGSGVKGIMICNTTFQSGGITFAKNKNLMLIEVDKDNNHSIKLFRTNSRKKTEYQNTDSVIINFIKKTLSKGRVKGLTRLTADQIEEITQDILVDYNKNSHPLEINSFIQYLQNKYKLNFDFTKKLETIDRNEIIGYFDNEINTIYIDNQISQSEKFPFILGHEVGHYFLHRNLKMNQQEYNDFADAEYNYFSDRHDFKNDRNWIEWQANKFSISLFLPKNLFYAYLISFRKKLGISRPHIIYLDDQLINIQDYIDTVNHLAYKFGISKTVVKYRIEELGIITYAKPKNDLRAVIRQIIVTN